jgi:E3 ubiquitin-protein ligase Mdm2
VQHAAPAAEHVVTGAGVANPIATHGGNERHHDATLCVICMERSRDATIGHGDSGHVCCCMQCARRLKERGMPCPMCREHIEMVIRHFLSS